MNGLTDNKLKELAEHLGAAAAYYMRRTGAIGGEGLIEHLQAAAVLYFRARQSDEEVEKNDIEQEDVK